MEGTAAGQVRAVRWQAWGAFMDWREFFPDPALAIQDPTSLESEPLQDAGRVAVRPGGLGRGDVVVNGRWMGGAAVEIPLPWRFQAAALLHARDGFPIPYFQVASTGDPTSGAKNVLVSPHLDTYRLPAVVMLDARLAREIAVGGRRARLLLDVFNLGNRASALQVARDVELPAFARAREIARPRLVRLGVELLF